MLLQSRSEEDTGFDDQVHLHKTEKMPSCLLGCFFLAKQSCDCFLCSPWRAQSAVTSSVGFESQGASISLVVSSATGETRFWNP